MSDIKGREGSNVLIYEGRYKQLAEHEKKFWIAYRFINEIAEDACDYRVRSYPCDCNPCCAKKQIESFDK